MSKRILIDANYIGQYRVAVVDGSNTLEDIEYEMANNVQIKNNIYVAKVVRIEPALQAVFVDYGTEKNGFLPLNEIHRDYYVRDGNVPNLRDVLHKLSPLHKLTDEILSSDTTLSESIANENAALNDDDSYDVLDRDSMKDFDNDSEGNKDEIDSPRTSERVHLLQAIKKGQLLLVQVQKEERGNKGASLTTYISLAGKYCVLMPNFSGRSGVSRKIGNSDERKRLRNILQTLLNNDAEHSSLIARTAGIAKSVYDLHTDYNYLANLWNNILTNAYKVNYPALLHIEDNIVQKTIRDFLDHRVSEVIIQGNDAYEEAISFTKSMLPSCLNKVKEHKVHTPVFATYGVEEQISQLYQQIVHLPSGGYMVINPTEALTAIDINSGKSTSERNIEDTAMKTNLEAVREIARQLRLRDISGLIVIDFIDMYDGGHRKTIERTLREMTNNDKAIVQVAPISDMGLLEMSRQRLHSTFLESHTVMCPHCNGKGLIRANESNAMVILRMVESELCVDETDVINVYASQSVVLYIMNHKRMEIAMIEEKYGVKLYFHADPQVVNDSFAIERVLLPHYDVNLEEDRKHLTRHSYLQHQSTTKPIKIQENKSKQTKAKEVVQEQAMSEQLVEKPVQAKAKNKRSRAEKAQTSVTDTVAVPTSVPVVETAPVVVETAAKPNGRKKQPSKKRKQDTSAQNTQNAHENIDNSPEEKATPVQNFENTRPYPTNVNVPQYNVETINPSAILNDVIIRKTEMEYIEPLIENRYTTPYTSEKIHQNIESREKLKNDDIILDQGTMSPVSLSQAIMDINMVSSTMDSSSIDEVLKSREDLQKTERKTFKKRRNYNKRKGADAENNAENPEVSVASQEETSS